MIDIRTTKKIPLHRLQFLNQASESTETGLDYVVNREKCIGKAGVHRDFLFIEKCKKDYCKWIHCMLQGSSKLLGDETTTTTKGCPQGAVLSPTRQSLVINSKLKQGPYYTIGNEDNIVILVNGS